MSLTRYTSSDYDEAYWWCINVCSATRDLAALARTMETRAMDGRWAIPHGVSSATLEALETRLAALTADLQALLNGEQPGGAA